jgi:hypothetical protein
MVKVMGILQAKPARGDSIDRGDPSGGIDNEKAGREAVVQGCGKTDPGCGLNLN